jgi:acetoin utilization deacetylase AcuC-like enzyme
MKPAFIYSTDYYADIGAHVFPTEKYHLLYDRLVREGLVREDEFLEPTSPPAEDLLLVHTREYIDDLKSARWTHRTLSSEMPLSKEIVAAFVLGAGGTIMACAKALERGMACNLGGGLHHAFADHAEGFCYINDIAVGIAKMKQLGRVKKAAVIDCDLHQGNGTAVIFQGDPEVFTFSIHQENLYPIKQKSDWDIGLWDGTMDEEYLELLAGAVPRILDDHRPDLVVYQAGADPYEHDQLGMLRLTIKGLLKRDGVVLGECWQRRIPVAVTLGGGYAVDTRDTVTIHLNTFRVAIELGNRER